MTEKAKEEVKQEPAESKVTRNKRTARTTKTTQNNKQASNASVSNQKKEDDISSYVSNLDKNVYAITGLPEEFIATLFAWVSRSPKSFRDHLREAIKEFDLPTATHDSFAGLSQKAKDFHEKWTVGYGHSSVAENAVAHVGIEGISRLASAELELSNTFLSITEYSQRYQKPERGKWHNPLPRAGSSMQFSSGVQTDDFEPNPLHKEYEDFMHKAFDSFEQLIEGVYTYLKKQFVESKEYQEIKDDEKKVNRKLDALMKLAFEDARYALPLSMHTQLGMTANGRAWRDALAVLGNSDHLESQKLSQNLKEEITKVLPILLKYATPSQYQCNSKKRMNVYFSPKHMNLGTSISVNLHAVKAQPEVVNQIIALLHQQKTGQSYARSYQEARSMAKEAKEKIIKDLLFEMESFDMAPEVFKHVPYQASFLVSEANWHQLLRHNRMTDFTYGPASVHIGLTIPPRIKEAGVEHIMKDIARESEQLYNKLVESDFDKEAEYVVLNAHRRHIFATFSLWEAYHLINLRTSEEAQWDIRQTFEDLYYQMNFVHPLLLQNAKRR